jgi:hypothetical protein
MPKRPLLQKHYSSSTQHHHINNLNENSADYVFQLQRAIGNQAVQRLMHPNNGGGFDFAKIAIQPKLKISQPGDEYEQEADRVAEQVMKMSVLDDSVGPMMSTKEEGIDRKCAVCEMKEEEEEKVNLNISRRAVSTTTATLEGSDEIANEIKDIRSSGGSSLDPDTKKFMEPRFGYDFGNIRIHADEKSARSANSIKALAYTVGNNIVFGEGQYQPNTLNGRRLLAHELIHVIQQASSRDSMLQRTVDPNIVDDSKCCLSSGGEELCEIGQYNPFLREFLQKAHYWATRMAHSAHGTLDWQLFYVGTSSYEKEDEVNMKIRELLMEHFKLDIEDPSHHERIGIIERRYRKTAELLESGKLMYSCDNRCPGDYARVFQGQNHIFICEKFHNAGSTERALSLLHECLHILYWDLSHPAISRYEEFAKGLTYYYLGF